MRAALTRKSTTRHDPICKYRVDPDNGYITYFCTPTCAIAALGDGDSSKGVEQVVTAMATIEIKIANRKRRMNRKKRRGWA